MRAITMSDRGFVFPRRMGTLGGGKTTLSKVERIRLALALKDMTPRSQLFRMLKAEMEERGHWRNAPRGNPEKGYERGLSGNGEGKQW